MAGPFLIRGMLLFLRTGGGAGRAAAFVFFLPSCVVFVAPALASATRRIAWRGGGVVECAALFHPTMHFPVDVVT
jgi:hypothetical protein